MSFRLFVVSACALGLGVAVGCDGSSTVEDIPPITGIRIDALTLFGADACGRDAGQIVKYAATATSAFARPADGDAAEDGTESALDTSQSAAQVFDCFTDGTFVDLPYPSTPVVANYTLRVYAYSDESYADGRRVAEALGSAPNVREDALAEGAVLIASCTATQRTDVRTNAVCTIEKDERAAAPNGDAGTDAGDGGASDGDASDGDASDSDAGTDTSDGDASDGDASDGGEPDADE